MDAEMLLSGQRIRNVDAFQLLRGLFTGASGDDVRSHVLDCMLLQVFALSPANY